MLSLCTGVEEIKRGEIKKWGWNKWLLRVCWQIKLKLHESWSPCRIFWKRAY